MCALVDALGEKKSVAKSVLAEYFGVSEDTIGRHYKAYCKEQWKHQFSSECNALRRGALAKLTLSRQENFKDHPLFCKYQDRWHLSRSVCAEVRP